MGKTYAANGQQLAVASAVLGPVALVFVALRFLARKKKKAHYGADDWFALAALLLFWGILIENFVSGKKTPITIEPKYWTLPQINHSLLAVFIQVYLMLSTITCARFSVIFLYNRIFGIYKRFKYALYGIGAASILWFLVCFLLNTLRCHPTSNAWNAKEQSKCLNLQVMFLYTELINCVLDLSLVCLPIFKIPKLNLSLRDKVAVFLVFCTGGFVCITSIVRISVTYNPKEEDSATILSAFWLILQLSFAVICACLPPLRAFLPGSSGSSEASSLRKFLSSTFKKTSSKGSKGSRSSQNGEQDVFNRPFYGQHDGSSTESNSVERASINYHK